MADPRKITIWFSSEINNSMNERDLNFDIRIQEKAFLGFYNRQLFLHIFVFVLRHKMLRTNHTWSHYDWAILYSLALDGCGISQQHIQGRFHHIGENLGDCLGRSVTKDAKMFPFYFFSNLVWFYSTKSFSCLKCKIIYRKAPLMFHAFSNNAKKNSSAAHSFYPPPQKALH